MEAKHYPTIYKPVSQLNIEFLISAIYQAIASKIWIQAYFAHFLSQKKKGPTNLKTSKQNNSDIIIITDYGHPIKVNEDKRYLKKSADVADKICFGRFKKFGSGSEFTAVQWRLFPFWTSVVRDDDDH